MLRDVHHHHHHHISVMELGHLLTRSGLTYPEASSKVCHGETSQWLKFSLKPLNPELNPICYLLALLGAQHFLHVSRIRVKLLNFRLLMSYIYMTLVA